MSLRSDMIILIVITAICTYSLRLGGLLFSSFLPESGSMRRVLDALPGTILISFVLPGIAQQGTAGVAAAAFTVLIAVKTRNVLLSMSGGVALIFLLHRFFLL